jgi:hypothetical protein
MTAPAPAADERWPDTTRACRGLAGRVVKALADAGYQDASDPARDRAAPAFAVTADPLGVTIDADFAGRPPDPGAPVLFRNALRRAGMRPMIAGGHLLLQSPKPVLWNGKRIKGRALQTRLWAALIGLLGVGLIAGVYYAIWQMHWTFGPTGISWSLKRWWDAGDWWPATLGHWPDYRHDAFRNQLQPALATVLILSALAGPKLWAMRVGPVNLALRLLALLVLGVGLGVLGVYLRDFGLPGAWAHGWAAAGRPGYSWTGAFYWAGRLSLFTLAWGALMGFVLHLLWGPAGATIQGYWVDRLADRARERGRVPLYIRLPLSPTVVRERFSWLYMRPEIELSRPGRLPAWAIAWLRWLAAAVTLGVFLTIALGLLAKYWIAHGHTVPYIAP